MLVWLDGSYVPAENARVSLFDRGYLLGDGAFATMRAIEGKVFRERRHLELLDRALSDLGIGEASLVPSLQAPIRECLQRASLGDATVRVTVTRGPGKLGLAVSPGTRPTVSILVRESAAVPEATYVEGTPVRVLTTRKIPSACLPQGVKSTSYLGQVLAHRELLATELEGIQLTVAGDLSSGTASNVFVVRDGILSTPDAGSDCRLGVTRGVVLELATALGIPTRCARLSREELKHADEVFFTSTRLECLPASSVSGRQLGPARVAGRLREGLRREMGANTY